MLVRADAFPVVELVKSAELVDAGAAALWVHLACFDALNEEIAEARPEIDAVWKSVVSERSWHGRRALVRKAIERRIEGGEIDDIVKAGAGIALVRGYLAKAAGEVEPHSGEPDGEDPTKDEPRDARGRWTRNADRNTKQQKTSYDALNAMTTRADPNLRGRAENVSEQLRGTNYDRMRVLGNTLVATGHPQAAMAGGIARTVAEVGPSAEQVLGPHLRRIAYRYRGTEKRPDAQLVREVNDAANNVAILSATPRTDQERLAQQRVAENLESRAPGEWGKGTAAYRLAEGGKKGWSEDQVELRATGDVAATHLIRQLPTVDEAFLSQAAGRTPPSIGVIIDRDGDVVSEAQGFNGDHYVPFDLKNLKRLQGGSYVRTRALGGPTSEDIYTGLLGGARQTQVVSRSGVFTIEFDPDLRGGRRYSDKAKQMVDRYSRILDRVEQSGQGGDKAMYTQDVPDERQRELWAQAMDDADYDDADAKVRFERDMARERNKLSLGYSQEDLQDQADAQLNEWASHQREKPTRTEVGRMREQILREVTESAAQDKQAQSVRRLQLNAEGYYRAMQSLKREFPFYIRDVDYEPLRDFEQRRGTRARGEEPPPRGAPPAKGTHVQRGNLVPAGQAAAYGITQQVTRTGAAAPRKDADEGEGAAGKPKTPTGDSGSGGGGAAVERLAGAARAPKFVETLTGSLDSIGILNTIPQTFNVRPLLDKEGNFPGRKEAAADVSITPTTYLSWLQNPSNPVTHGTLHGVARFITEDADETELSKIQDGLETMARINVDEPKWSGSERIPPLKKLVDQARVLRYPFAKVEGDVALHMPDEENPKPAPVKEVLEHKSLDLDDPDSVDDVRRKLGINDPNMDAAFKWIDDYSNDADAGRALRKEVVDYKTAQEFGTRLQAAASAGKPAPKKPDFDYDLDAVRRIAAEPDNNTYLRALKAKQAAYAWKRLKSISDALAGGGAAPKARTPAIEGEVSARDSSSRRRVTKLAPDHPMSVALAKRLRPPARR